LAFVDHGSAATSGLPSASSRNATRKFIGMRRRYCDKRGIRRSKIKVHCGVLL
jgi:hypothetical protein